MKKSYIILIAVAVFIFIVIASFTSTYNSLVTKQEAVTAQWKNVETSYQARADKTKNLASIVKGAASFEKETLENVVKARAAATSIKIDADNLTPEALAKFEKAQASYGSSLGRLLAVAENYPQLQSVQAFRDFQTQYEGMENRISTERRKYNEIAQEYNTDIRRFPRNIVANFSGFTKKPYFEAQAGTENAPDIDMKLK